MSAEYDKGRCPICDRVVGGYVPKGGDGTAIRLVRHKVLGVYCEGRFCTVDRGVGEDGR